MSLSRCASAASITSRGCAVVSPAQSRKVERKPCAVRSPRPIRLQHRGQRHVGQRLAGDRRAAGTPAHRARRARRAAPRAAGVSGTRCSLPALMRPAGTVHTRRRRRRSRPRSCRAPRPSGRRSGSRTPAPWRRCLRGCASSAMKAGASRQSERRMVLDRASPWSAAAGGGRDGPSSGPGCRPCARRAPRRSPAPPRCAGAPGSRSRACSVQIGRSTASTSRVSTAFTSRSPSFGIGVGRQRRGPLRRVLGVAPARPLALDQRLGGGLEGAAPWCAGARPADRAPRP